VDEFVLKSKLANMQTSNNQFDPRFPSNKKGQDSKMIEKMLSIRKLLKVEEFLNKHEAEWTRKLHTDSTIKKYVESFEIREIVEEKAGHWDLSRASKYYDVLSMPFLEGTLSIERPWVNVKTGELEAPFRVKFVGPEVEGLEDKALAFVKSLFEHAHARFIERLERQRQNAS
jgi:hypothetical protein